MTQQSPTSTRKLIVNIDDFGMCDSTTQAALEVLRSGNAGSTTIMMPCSWAPYAAGAVAGIGEVDVGVHLTLFSEFAGYRWGPITGAASPTLIDESGRYFYSERGMEEFVRIVTVADVEQELRAQIEAALAAGIAPTHLDSHCHGHERREDIFEMSLKLALDYGLPMRIAYADHRRAARERGLPVADHDTVDSMRIDAADKPKRYLQMLEELPPGISEWAIHPALDSEEIRRIDPDDWEKRTADYRFFGSTEFTEALQAHGIELTRYSAFAHGWKRRA